MSGIAKKCFFVRNNKRDGNGVPSLKARVESKSFGYHFCGIWEITVLRLDANGSPNKQMWRKKQTRKIGLASQYLRNFMMGVHNRDTAKRKLLPVN